MRLKILVTVVAALVLLPLASWADTASATDTSTGITYDLTYTFTGSGGTGSLLLTSVCTDPLSVDGCADNLDAFAVSGATATATNANFQASGNVGTCADGFQSFITNLNDGNSPNACLVKNEGQPPGFPQTFAITNATDIVFHAASFNSGCSLWFRFLLSDGVLSGGETNNGGLESGCGTPVPEPGSLALLGSGLVAAAGFLRRRLLA